MENTDPAYVIFNRRPKLPNQEPTSPFVLTDFISGSTLKPRYPTNYPYSIYNTAWATSEAFLNNDEDKTFGQKCECLGKKIWWWEPSQDNIASEFMESSSMHGLKYVSQRKRHLIERIFWFLSFIACIVRATLMIMDIWRRYYENPVIVTFNPIEQEVDAIPFPAITICNTNPFKRSRVEQYSKQYKEAATKQQRMAALDALRFINAICSNQQSFLKGLNFAPRRGEITWIPEAKEHPSLESEKKLTEFLLRNTQPCRELLRICVWEQQNIDCEKIFKPIITDYGKCCTFNMLPKPLLENFNSSAITFESDPLMKNLTWTQEDLKEWQKWNYDDDGYIINPNLTYPYRQRRAGSAGGLSILIDPDLEDSFCPSTDSMGIKVLYHVPLDAPRLANLGSVVGVNQEASMEMNPDLTIADEEITSYFHETRKCYFGREFPLKFYKPYTRNNCMEQCWNEILLRRCRCVLYYTPRNSTTNVYSTNTASTDFQCIQKAEESFIGTLHKLCKYCKYSCNDLKYNAEITGAQLLHFRELWGNGENTTKEEWMTRSISILHIFMGSDSTVPKLRQKLYQTVDLIANTGGLLGLSIGFSVLSAVEIVYFATVRVCCKRVRRKWRKTDEEEDISRTSHVTERLPQQRNQNPFNPTLPFIN